MPKKVLKIVKSIHNTEIILRDSTQLVQHFTDLLKKNNHQDKKEIKVPFAITDLQYRISVCCLCNIRYPIFTQRLPPSHAYGNPNQSGSHCDRCIK